MGLENIVLTTQQKIMIVLCAIPFLMVQAAWIFRDARKRGEKKYWLWGLFGLMHIPQSLIVYLIVTRVILDRNKK